jgi:hypothetical protein
MAGVPDDELAGVLAKERRYDHDDLAWRLATHVIARIEGEVSIHRLAFEVVRALRDEHEPYWGDSFPGLLPMPPDERLGTFGIAVQSYFSCRRWH